MDHRVSMDAVPLDVLTILAKMGCVNPEFLGQGGTSTTVAGEECQTQGVDSQCGRVGGGPEAGSGSVSVARGFQTWLAGGVLRRAHSGEAGGAAVPGLRAIALRLRGGEMRSVQ